MASRLNGPAFFVRHICFANVRWMESLSGDYDNAFTDTKGGLFSVCVVCACVCVGWGNLSFVCVSPAGGKSNKSDWRHFGYWLKALCSARHSHLRGIPRRVTKTCSCIHVAVCVCVIGLIGWMNFSLLALRTEYVPLSIMVCELH